MQTIAMKRLAVWTGQICPTNCFGKPKTTKSMSNHDSLLFITGS